MKKIELKLLFFVTLFLLQTPFITASLASGNNSSITDVTEIIRQISIYSVQEVYQKLVGEAVEGKNGRKIVRLNEEISEFSGQIRKHSDWTLTPYNVDLSGFSIRANGQFGYRFKFSTSETVTPYVCKGSHESNGKNLWVINDQLLVVEEWSCGTLGCDYLISFINTKISHNNLPNFCRGV